jgi:O-antigen/teichoic acid export membrane protein
MTSELNQPVRHAATYLVARGLPGVVAFLAIPIFTRLIEPAEYGRYALVVTTTGLLNALVFQWLPLSVVRHVNAAGADLARLKSTLLTCALGLIVVAGLVAGAACMLPVGHGWRAAIACGWGLLSVQAVFDLCVEYTRAAIRPGRYMALQLARSLCGVGLGTALVLLGAGWWGPVAGFGVGMGLAVAAALLRDWSDVRLLVDRDLLARVVRYGVPISATVGLGIVTSGCDRFLIAGMVGTDAAGLYSVAVDFANQTLTLVMMAVSMACFPLAVRAWETLGRDAAAERMRVNAALLLAVGVPSVVGLATLAPAVTHVLFGTNYRDAATAVVPLVALGAFLAAIKGFHFDAAFQFSHRTVLQVWIALATAAAGITLNLIAIPLAGIRGAAGAWVVACALAVALTCGVGRRYVKLPLPRRDGARVFVASAAMAAALYPIRDFRGAGALVGQVAAGAAVYAGALVWLNFMGCRERLIGRTNFGRATGASAANAVSAVAGSTALTQAP